MNKEEIIIRSLTRNNTQIDFGKLPPQAKDMEEAVIAAAMIEATAMPLVADFIKSDMFYVDAHIRIWNAIEQLHIERKPIDLLTVTEQLRKNNDLDSVGGPFAIAQLTNKIGTAANIEEHARIIFEKHIQRRVISVSSEAQRTAYEDSCDPFELLDRTEKEFRALQTSIISGQVEDIGMQIEDAYNQIEASASQTGKTIIKSKHKAINKNFNGWQRGTLNIIAARPGMGKSAFHVSELVNLIRTDYKVASFNPEMSKRQLYSRIFCNLAEISNKKLKRFELSNTDMSTLHEEIQWLKNKRNDLFIDFTGGVQISHVSNICRKIKLEQGLDVVFIDYLQLVRLDSATAKGINRDQYIGEITRELKTISKNLDVCVIAFCQLNRAAEAKADKRPSMSELRESGNIENDADTISFLLRPEYYFNKDADGKTIYENSEQEQFKNVCQFINAKNREDTIFEDEIYCDLGRSSFVDMSQAPSSTPF
jgi:replicative DNA helicase